MKIITTNVDGDTAFISNHQGLVGFRAEIYDVDIDLPTWADALLPLGFLAGLVFLAYVPFIGISAIFSMSVLSGAIIPGIIENRESQATKQLNQKIANAQTNIFFPLPGTAQPQCNIRLVDFVSEKDGINGWFNLLISKYAFSPLTLNGNSSDVQWIIDVTNKNKINISFALPSKGFYHPDDPLIRIRWEVFADEVFLFQKDNNIKTPKDSQPFNITINRNLEALQVYGGFRIICRLYRPWGDFTEEIYKIEKYITIADRISRRKKYVMWGPHRVYWQEYAHRKNNPERKNNKWYWNGADRKSKIHKTDIDVRCKFVTEYSSHRDNKLHYTDELPFPIEKIAENRHLVCDYCFFGGPDKKRLKPDQ